MRKRRVAPALAVPFDDRRGRAMTDVMSKPVARVQIELSHYVLRNVTQTCCMDRV